IGIWAGMAGIGVAIGPLAGGLLLTFFPWGSVFFVNIPIAAAGIVTIWKLVPESRAPDAPPIDVRGAALSFIGMIALFYGLIQGPDKGWTSIAVVLGFCLSAVFIALFIWLELRTPNPLLEIRFFKIPEFSSGVLSIAIGFFALFGLLYVITMYIQSVLSYSPMKAGFALLPFAVVLLILSPVIPRFVRFLSARVVVASGLLLTGAGMLVFTRVSTTTAYPLILLGMLLVSIGMTSAQVPSSNAIMGSIPKEKAGEGSATNAAIRQIGSSLGIALIGGIAQLGYSSTITKSAAYQALSPSAAGQAGSGLAGALHIGSQMGSSGDAIVEAAKSAFVRGLDASMFMTAIIAFIGALIAFRFIPRKMKS
ncbi:MAG: MFS transporter, partial [Actinobacteria bacterium]|nr:MFS transporter [Actinomycetota bacterium]